MKTTDITSGGVFYHISAGSGDSASKWIEGAARKGVYDGKVGISILMFPADKIAEALEDVTLLGAELILRRDSGYGVGTAIISLAPMSLNAMPEGYMSRSQSIGQAMRQLHFSASTEGTSVSIRIPGATLREIKAGRANAFLLYGETDGTDTYVRLSTEAVLRMYTGEKQEGGTELLEWVTPEYTRGINSGDLISSDIYSHIADLREIEYYLNIRRRFDGMSEIDDIGDNHDLGAYRDWAAIMQDLQDGMNGVLTHEERDQVDWTEAVVGMLPSAAIVEEIRGVLRGDDEARVECDAGITAEQSVAKTTTGMSNTKMNWTAGATVKAGKLKTSETAYVDGVQRTVTVWKLNAGGWVFERDETIALTSAAVELTIKAAEEDAEQVHIVLKGLIISAAPSGMLSYSEVFHDTVIGEADGAVGETVRIPINAAGLRLLNDRTIHGVGIPWTNQRVECARSATLLTNAATEPEPDPEPEEEAEE